MGSITGTGFTSGNQMSGLWNDHRKQRKKALAIDDVSAKGHAGRGSALVPERPVDENSKFLTVRGSGDLPDEPLPGRKTIDIDHPRSRQ
jgi:hypothetical protein